MIRPLKTGVVLAPFKWGNAPFRRDVPFLSQNGRKKKRAALVLGGPHSVQGFPDYYFINVTDPDLRTLLPS